MSAIANATNIESVSDRHNSTSDNDPSQNRILTLTFNQDCTALTMGTISNYSLFTIDPKNIIHETLDCGIKPLISAKCPPFEDIHIAERLFISSFIALVSRREARKLYIFDIKRGLEIFTNKLPTNILAVKVSHLRLIVCLEEAIWIFDKPSLKTLQIIRDIPSNPKGLCALSLNADNPFLAYPGSAITGTIHIYNAVKLEQLRMINAHNGPLVAMSFDLSGTRIATASVKGTVIRIRSVLDGSCLFEFRRGVLRAATIYSLVFSPDAKFLAVSSNTGTVHIFQLIDPTTSSLGEPITWMGLIGQYAVGFLPKSTSEVFTQDRAYATVHLQSAEMRTTIAMNNMNEKAILFVACYDGNLSAYEIKTGGGECQRLAQCGLFNMSTSLHNEFSTSMKREQDHIDEPEGVYPPNLFKNNNQITPNAST